MVHTPPPRVVATTAAAALIERLARRYGPVMFFQMGEAGDRGSPMCYPMGDFNVGQADVCLGTLNSAPFYIGYDHFEQWKQAQMIIDVAEGMGGMFSLENGSGKRFFTRSRPFTDEELDLLEVEETRDRAR